MLYGVIMAGGQGTRLWPVSRKKLPKQLQKLAGEKSMIRETYERILPAIKPDNIYISTVPEYAGEIKRQIPEIPPQNYVVEPINNGNAAACGLASEVIYRRDPKSVAVFISSDHVVKNRGQFCDIIGFADRLIAKYPEHIMTIGIEPTKPDTGLGYIQMDHEVESDNGLRAFRVKRFIEKPNLERAKRYASSWQYLWNAGIFVWRTSHMLDLMEQYVPKTRAALKTIGDSVGKSNFETVLAAEYGKTENTSIDYAVMEKTKDILVIPGDFGWSDIGSWGTLYELLSEMTDSKVVSRGHHIGHDDTNCLVYAGDKLVATVGLEDVVVVDTPDALLICNRHKSQQIKELLGKIKEAGKEEYL